MFKEGEKNLVKNSNVVKNNTKAYIFKVKEFITLKDEYMMILF